LNLKWKLITYVFVFLVILASCVSTPAQSPLSNSTDTPRATITQSSIAVPTATSSPTSTHETRIYIPEDSTSPNGEWRGIVTITTIGEDINILFELSNSNSGQVWQVENKDFKEPENPMDGYLYPYIFKWSDNDNSLYYSHLTTGGDGCYIPSEPGGYGFRKFNLSTGQDTLILEKRGTWLALSPDETKLAYIQDWDGNVTLLDTESQAEQIIPLPPITDVDGLVDTTDHILWSPDGNSFVYAFLWGDCGDYFISYILYFDINTQKQSVLINHDEHGYIPVEWNEQDRILLLDNEDNNWWLDPTTKEITPVSQ